MILRRATVDDRAFLEQMIVEAAFPPGRIPGFADAIGAAHCRRFGGDEPGLGGFVDGDTPVVAVAVVPGERARGVGGAMLEALAAAARADGLAALSLSVGRANPALRLYERLGWQRLAGAPDRPLRLLRRL